MNGSGMEKLMEDIKDFDEEKIGKIEDDVNKRKRNIKMLREKIEEIEKEIEGEDIKLELREENMRIDQKLIGRIKGDVDVEEIMEVMLQKL